jgi:hypothetical protein
MLSEPKILRVRSGMTTRIANALIDLFCDSRRNGVVFLLMPLLGKISKRLILERAPFLQRDTVSFYELVILFDESSMLVIPRFVFANTNDLAQRLLAGFRNIDAEFSRAGIHIVRQADVGRFFCYNVVHIASNAHTECTASMRTV